MIIRLEYSESAGHFHFARLSESGANTNGYTTLAPKMDASLAETFCNLTNQKYGLGNGSLHEKPPSFLQMEKELVEFTGVEIQKSKERIEKLNQQRGAIFKNSQRS